MRKTLSLILLFSLTLVAQEWQFRELAPFAVLEQSNRRGLMMQELTASERPGLAMAEMDMPEYARKAWMQCDFWLDPEKPADFYLVFGFGEGDSLQLWAAGYSLAEKDIRFARVAVDSQNIRLEPLVEKSVEIRHSQDQYVFRFIFPTDSRELQIEVNGVPLIAERPFGADQLTRFGYLIRGGAVRFFPFYFDGQ
ncbi:MAG: hypothetical protein KDI06_03655 [Calditrichaeota bacterium]|nr:hypothetical protein [Calditrichota bacterium]HQU70724.1 hypothetical protein [Calditrichia bacterium]